MPHRKVDKNFLRLSDEKEERIQSSREYRYMKVLRFILKILSSWPGKELGENESKYKKLLSYFLIMYSLLFLILNSLYLKNNSGKIDFFVLGHTYITAFMGVVSTTRLSYLPLSKRYLNVVTHFVSEIHLFRSKYDSEYARKTHIKVHKYSNLFTIGVMTQMILALVLFQVIPVYNNYSKGLFKMKNLKNNTYELSVYFALPLDSTTNFNHYVITSIITIFISYVCASTICSFDLLLSLIIIHVWGHFQILLHNINDFPEPIINNTSNKNDTHLFSSEEMDQISTKLNKCIDHHRVIVKFIKEISSVFGPMLFIYYAFHQVSGCLLLLVCSPMTGPVLMRFGPLTVIIFQQLIQLSIVFELIGSASEKLKDAVYGVPWVYMDKGNKKTLLIFLINVQEPIHVKALGLADVGVQSMAAILKTSLSYFTFLLTVVK